MSKRAAKTPARRETPAPEVVETVSRRDVLVQMGVVFAVAALARGLHFWLMRDSVFFEILVCDAAQYDVWGRRLAAGNWIGTEIFYQTPLYPYFLGVVYTIFGHSVWAVRIIQALLGSAACAFVARAGSGYFSHRAGWASGLILALYPPAIFFDGIVQKAALDLVFMAGLLWAVAATQRAPVTWRFVLTGLLLGGMTLNRENAAVLVPLLALWALWLSWNDPLPVKLRRGVAMVVGLAAVLLPVGFRNYHVGGQFLLTTSQMGPNFYIGNHAGASGLYEALRPGRGDPLFESLDARLLAEQASGRSLTPKEVSDYWMGRSWTDIQSDPIWWFRLLSWKWLMTWNTMEFVDAESITVHERESFLLGSLDWVLNFGVLCPLAAVGIWFTRHDWRRLWVLYAMLLAFAAAVTLFFVFARYRYPLVPVATLFAGAGLIGAWKFWQVRTPLGNRELAVAAALALVVAVFCNWPLSYLDSDEVTYVTTANGLWREFRPDDALDLLKTAVSINPRSMPAYNNMGCAALQLNKLDDAQMYFERAIQLNPKYPQAIHGLGQVFEKRQQMQAATEQWRLASQLDPLFAAPVASLGHAALVEGQYRQAISQLTQCLKLEQSMIQARVDLALAHIALGETGTAAKELQIAVGQIPRVSEANNLAWILATAPDPTLRDPEDAVRLAETACLASDYKEAELLDTLAAALANVGKFDQAVEWSDKAIALARKKANQPLLDALAERRELYVKRQPYRDTSIAPKAKAAS